MSFRRFYCAAVLLLGILGAGCRSPYGGDANNALGVPPEGNVRVVTTRIAATPDTLHYKWSLIGATNWRKAAASGSELSLSDTYALNSATERGGCNVYEADLTADRATGKWRATLHGSDGTTVQSEGTLPPGKSATDAVRITQDTPSASLGLPTDLTVAQIDGTPLRVHIAR